ncbi:MAG: pyridoxamine 5'-phosphate oxidase family protein [Pirellulaceae bacterium]|nr:pyridoxamine 5'-phosphate oxidase family protein [Pirellulaceae bacterium]
MNHQERLLDLMENFRTAMLVTRQGDDEMTSRPMAVADLSENGEMWFVTSKRSCKVDEIGHHSVVLVTFQNSSQFVSVSGVAQVIDDPAKIDELWSESWKIWFPEGKDDPDLTLLHVTPTGGEYWDNSGLKGLKYLVKAGIAYMQGEQMSTSDDVNASVEM